MVTKNDLIDALLVVSVHHPFVEDCACGCGDFYAFGQTLKGEVWINFSNDTAPRRLRPPRTRLVSLRPVSAELKHLLDTVEYVLDVSDPIALSTGEELEVKEAKVAEKPAKKADPPAEPPAFKYHVPPLPPAGRPAWVPATKRLNGQSDEELTAKLGKPAPTTRRARKPMTDEVKEKMRQAALKRWASIRARRAARGE